MELKANSVRGELIELLALAKPNLYVIKALATRLGFRPTPGFNKSAVEVIDTMLRAPMRELMTGLEKKRRLDRQPLFEQSYFLNGFAWPDGKFRFKA